jgi:hypothetical protein
MKPFVPETCASFVLTSVPGADLSQKLATCNRHPCKALVSCDIAVLLIVKSRRAADHQQPCRKSGHGKFKHVTSLKATAHVGYQPSCIESLELPRM